MGKMWQCERLNYSEGSVGVYGMDGIRVKGCIIARVW